MNIWYEEVAKKDWFRSGRVDHYLLYLELSIDQVWLVSIERTVECGE